MNVGESVAQRKRRTLVAPDMNLSLDQSEGSVLSDDFLETPDDLDINVDDMETPDETDSLEFINNGNDLEWEGQKKKHEGTICVEGLLAISTALHTPVLRHTCNLLMFYPLETQSNIINTFSINAYPSDKKNHFNHSKQSATAMSGPSQCLRSRFLHFPFELTVLSLVAQMTLPWPRQSVFQVRVRKRGTPLAACGER